MITAPPAGPSTPLQPSGAVAARSHPWLIPGLALLGLTLLCGAILRAMGQPWWCSCGQARLVVLDPFTEHCSQHVLDPYTISHALHGVIFCGLLALVARRVSLPWRLFMAAALEAGWEVLENTPMVIGRYRAVTASLGYSGDSVVNSTSDILACSLGFLVAWRIGWRWSVAVIVVAELGMLFWLRDNLTLNVLMLVYPIEAIKTWQIGG